MKTKLTIYIIPLAFILLFISCKRDKGKEIKNENFKKEYSVTSILDKNLIKGKEIYEGKGKCQNCHQANGKGIENIYPPLAGADYLLEDKERVIIQTIQGSSKPITVNGITYPGNIMSASVADINFTDEEIAFVVSYILNSWGNNAGTVTIEDVQNAKKGAGIEF